VTAASSNLPGGQELVVGDWNHTSVRTGATFPVFQDYLSGNHAASLSTSQASDQKNKPSPVTNQWVDGGPLAENAKITFHVEEDVEGLTIQLLTAEKLADLQLISPSGKVADVKIQEREMEEGIFKDAIGYNIELPTSEVGTWTVEVNSKAQENAYLLVANFEAESLIDAESGFSLLQKKDKVEIQANQAEVDVDSLTVDYHIVETENPANQRKWSASGKGALSYSEPFVKSKKDSIYTATINIEGKTKAGNKFNRSVIYSY
jgi:hypothetical protein